MKMNLNVGSNSLNKSAIAIAPSLGVLTYHLVCYDC